MQGDMKKMIFILTVGWFISLSFLSCDFLGDDKINNQTAQNIDKNEGKPNDEKAIERDSIPESFPVDANAKANELSIELKNTKNELNRLKKAIEEINSPSATSFIVPVVLFIIVIAIIIIYIKLGEKINYRDLDAIINSKIPRMNGQHVDFYRLDQRLKHLERDFECLEDGASNLKAPAGSLGVENRLDILEKKMSMLEKRNLAQVPSAFSTSRPQYADNNNQEEIEDASKVFKVGYANINNKKYFVDILDSMKESCVYKITFNKSDSATFNLISLDKIKYRNGWDDVIDYEGDCSMEEASNYTLLSPGTIKKLDDSTWELTEKLKIRVFK